jgi:hypothetical protein
VVGEFISFSAPCTLYRQRREKLEKKLKKDVMCYHPITTKRCNFSVFLTLFRAAQASAVLLAIPDP